jgi:hypothetical protein
MPGACSLNPPLPALKPDAKSLGGYEPEYHFILAGSLPRMG